MGSKNIRKRIYVNVFVDKFDDDLASTPDMLVVLIIVIIEIGFLVVLINYINQRQDYSYFRKGLFSDTWEKIYGLVSQRKKPVRTSYSQTTIDQKNAADGFWSDIIARTFKSRRRYYRDVYLKSEAWKRKRAMVLRRDKWTCLRCGGPASEVHHRKYARRIGKEPIKWLESVCKSCHDKLHW